MDGRVCARGVTDMRAVPAHYENFTAKPAQGTHLEFFVEAFAILFGPPTLFPEAEFFGSETGRTILRELAAERLADIGIDKSRHTEPKIADFIEDQASRDLVMIVTAEEQRVTSSPVRKFNENKYLRHLCQCVIFASTFYLGQPGPTKVAQFLNQGRAKRQAGGLGPDHVRRAIDSYAQHMNRLRVLGLGHQRSWPLIFGVHARCVQFIGLLNRLMHEAENSRKFQHLRGAALARAIHEEFDLVECIERVKDRIERSEAA